MEKRISVPWQNYIVSAVLTAGILFGVFCLKLAIGSSVNILLKTAVIGAAIGIVFSAALLIIKKPVVLFSASIVLLIAWIIAPGASTISPAILFAGAVCFIASIPFIASLFACIPQKAGKQQ